MRQNVDLDMGPALSGLQMYSGNTPFFAFSEHRLRESVKLVVASFASSVVSVHYSVKSLALTNALAVIAEYVNGFSVSSLFEARLAREVKGDDALLHCVSPLLRENEAQEIIDICDRVTLNSASQLVRFGDEVAKGAELGLRLNPGLSFVGDARYDPCRRNSKLGVALDWFATELRSRPERFARVSGLHFHSNCDCDDLSVLVKVVRHVETVVSDDLRRFRWLNVGGGYSFEDQTHFGLLCEEFEKVGSTYGLEIVIEPGAAMVRRAGYLVSTVQDTVEGDDYLIAILDLSVNHWPEVFEYQFEPDIERHVEGAPHTYLLAGCSCLAGDLFGVSNCLAPNPFSNIAMIERRVARGGLRHLNTVPSAKLPFAQSRAVSCGPPTMSYNLAGSGRRSFGQLYRSCRARFARA